MKKKRVQTLRIVQQSLRIPYESLALYSSILVYFGVFVCCVLALYNFIKHDTHVSCVFTKYASLLPGAYSRNSSTNIIKNSKSNSLVVDKSATFLFQSIIVGYFNGPTISPNTSVYLFTLRVEWCSSFLSGTKQGNS